MIVLKYFISSTCNLFSVYSSLRAWKKFILTEQVSYTARKMQGWDLAWLAKEVSELQVTD